MVAPGAEGMGGGAGRHHAAYPTSWVVRVCAPSARQMGSD
jgi:hypothetical protein